MDDRKKVTLGRTNTAIVRGEEDLSVWDDEELMRGQRRDKNGRWSGRPPKVVPKAVHDELVRRKLSEAHEMLCDSVVAAVGVLSELATDKDVDSNVRLKASQTIVERVMGKTPERLQLEHRSRFAQALEDMVVIYDEDDVIDADVVDD